MKTTASNLRPSLLSHPNLVHLAYRDEYDTFQAARLEELAPRNVLAEITARETTREQWRRIRLWGAIAHTLETASGDDTFAATFVPTMDALHQAEASSTRWYFLWRQAFTADQQRPPRTSEKK